MSGPKRPAGILLHPTSLPGDGPIGSLGPDAHAFLDLLESARMTRWQVLPLGPTDAGGSPYNAESSFAGSDLLVSVELLRRDGLLPQEARAPSVPATSSRVDLRAASQLTRGYLREAFARLSGRLRSAAGDYRERQAAWLEDFALYRAIKRSQSERPWTQWPAGLRCRDESALREARAALVDEVAFECFVQWCFDSQWESLHRSANERGILMIGDIPIFPAADSADVWASQHLFKLDRDGHPTVLTGVPPDYFSETGQLWGNPHYDWPQHEAEGFHWWRERFAQTLRRVDIVRVDHFRGFAAAWEVPRGAENARNGEWRPGPGLAFFQELGLVDSPAIIAEDLGIITDDVRDLLRAAGFPGMKVLQFAFDSGPANEHLPHNHTPASVVYTGTHDNTTTAAWLDEQPPEARRHLAEYLGAQPDELLEALIRAALASVGATAILPLQDVIGLGAEARMNTPSRIEGNWLWRASPDAIGAARIEWLGHMVELYGRAPAAPPLR